MSTAVLRTHHIFPMVQGLCRLRPCEAVWRQAFAFTGHGGAGGGGLKTKEQQRVLVDFGSGTGRKAWPPDIPRH